MGLLDQKKEMENKLKFFITIGDKKQLLAYIDDISGTFRIYAEKFENIEQCKSFCQWYLNVCDEL